MHHAIYILVTLAVGFSLGRIHNKQKVEAKIAAAVNSAITAVGGAVKKI
jgi:hypothetical protein